MKLVTCTLFCIVFQWAWYVNGSSKVDRYLPQYHFVPRPFGWMNDPNGLFYDPITKQYHLFYQYLTPRVWGHAVSENLVDWRQLPVALENDEPYDKGGVYSGSATLVKGLQDFADNTPILSYAVSTNNAQCIAFPTNRSDPDLVQWTKFKGNPIIRSNGKSIPDGRDPTTAWVDNINKRYLMAYGTNQGGPSDGEAVVFSSSDFKTWNRVDGYLYQSNQTGMWECPDFFLIPGNTNNYLLKASTMGRDYYVIGTYNTTAVRFVPSPFQKIGLPTMLYDYGRFYASKSFFDERLQRQVLFGCTPPPSAGQWAGVQSLPRSMTLSPNAPKNNPRIRCSPIKELQQLRQSVDPVVSLNNIPLPPLSSQPINLVGDQLEIQARFALSGGADCGLHAYASLNNSKTMIEFTSFGLSVESEQTVTVYSDATHSSLDPKVAHLRHSGVVPGAQLTSVDVSIYLDHSIFEVYVNRGDVVVTARTYPMLEENKIFLYNQSNSSACTLTSLQAWQLRSIY